jgi:hypothetical protein
VIESTSGGEDGQVHDRWHTVSAGCCGWLVASMRPEDGWDTMSLGDGTPADTAVMERGTHFDYVAQAWVAGHDHAHFKDQTSPLVFCGADAVTCLGDAT